MESEDDYAALIERAANEGEFMSTERGGYVRWSAGDGVEVWAQIDKDNQLIGGNLHYVGESQVRLGVTGLIESNESDVSLYGWMEPGEDDIESGAYPLVCDVPAYYLRPTPLELPQVVTAQITAFAHDLTYYPDEATFSAAQDNDPKFAPNFFIPTGLFIGGSEDGEAEEDGEEGALPGTPGALEVEGIELFVPGNVAEDAEEGETLSEGVEITEGEVPQPYAMFAGTVKAARLERNPETELEFWVLRVETFSATLDVVAAPESVQEAAAESDFPGETSTSETTPQVGGIVSGTFYLSAHLLDLAL